MKKAHFFLLFIGLCALSCTRSRTTHTDMQGAVNSISVIIDDELWNGAVGDTIRNKFASPVVGLPDEEPLFSINQYPAKLLEGFMSDSRTVIVVKKQPGKKFQIIRNEFGHKQNVIHISGSTVSEIIQIIEEHAPSMIQMMREAEFAEMRSRIDTALIDFPGIRNRFRISLKVPQGYKPVLRDHNFLWLKKDIISGNMSIVVYDLPRMKFGKNIIADILRIRDSVGGKYIQGTAPDSRMVTEDAYSPYMAQVTIAGRKAYETRGTWELKNDFMMGPFVNYAILDEPNNRILMVEGFCYAPSKQKRDLIFELETIIRSISFEP